MISTGSACLVSFDITTFPVFADIILFYWNTKY